jgi:hypothetical protein
MIAKIAGIQWKRKKNGAISQTSGRAIIVKARTARIISYTHIFKWKFKASLALALTTGSSETKLITRGIPAEKTKELRKIDPWDKTERSLRLSVLASVSNIDGILDDLKIIDCDLYLGLFLNLTRNPAIEMAGSLGWFSVSSFSRFTLIS